MSFHFTDIVYPWIYVPIDEDLPEEMRKKQERSETARPQEEKEELNLEMPPLDEPENAFSVTLEDSNGRIVRMYSK